MLAIICSLEIVWSNFLGGKSAYFIQKDVYEKKKKEEEKEEEEVFG